MEYPYQYPWAGIVPPAMPQQPYGGASRWQPQQQANAIQGVRWVSSMDEVNGTTIGFGQSALFMFTGENAFAIKSVSASGVPTTKVFDFKERAATPPESYVTREEFEKLKEQINAKPAIPDWAAANESAIAAHIAERNADNAVVPGNPAAGAGAVLQPSCADGMDSFAAQ